MLLIMSYITLIKILVPCKKRKINTAGGGLRRSELGHGISHLMPLLMDRSFQRNIMEQGQAGREEAFQPCSYNQPTLLQVFFLEKNPNSRRRGERLARQGDATSAARAAVLQGSRSKGCRQDPAEQLVELRPLVPWVTHSRAPSQPLL